MSLRVWLPLTKDLRNQGLDDVTVTNNGATFNSAGKLGGSYTGRIDVSSSIIPTVLNGSEFTVAFWIYINEVPTGSGVADTYVMACGTSGTRTQFHIAIRQNGAGFAFCFYSDDYTFYNTVTDKVGKWMHVVCAFKNNTQIVYVDGTKVGERATAGGLNVAANSVLNIYAAHERLNDFRIYDHCLSLMEVKELSKGLVLHYPMADIYIEATTNLSNSKLSNSCYNAVTQKYNYGTNTDIYKESGTFEGRVCEKVHMGTNGLDAFPYVFFDYFQPPVGETRTLSFDYYPTIMDKVVFYTYSSPGSGNYIVNYKTPVSWSGSATIPVKLNQWNHIAITVTNTGSAASGYGYMQIGNVKHTSSTANYWLFENIQIEAKDHATGYAGPNGTRNVSTVYDCSGFINNGTISGNLAISNDTPKYSASTQFNGTQHIQAPFPCGAISEAVSVAVWGYENNWNTSSAERLIGAATNSSGWCIGDYGSENTLFAFYANGSYNAATGFKQLSAGWHHFVITFDGLHLNYYVDGQSFSSKTFSTKQTATGNYNIEIGRHYGGGYNFKGCMSDVRIYATALSADDVKSLYQNSAYIDSSGNVYGAIHES